jgi:hypothetical protein
MVPVFDIVRKEGGFRQGEPIQQIANLGCDRLARQALVSDGPDHGMALWPVSINL